MELRDLGFDSWFQAQAAELVKAGHHVARVTAVDRRTCLVRNEHTEIPAEQAGRLRYSAQSSADLPCVGDWVAVEYHSDAAAAVIHGVFPRRTFLRRKCAGKTVDFQMIAANIDTAFIVQSCHYDFNIRRLNRYLVMAREGGIVPMILLTKTDLVGPDHLEQIQSQISQSGIGDTVMALSNATGAGVEGFRRALAPGKTYCLLGSSGVGKTTLINRLIGRDVFGIKAVSGTGEGTHATARRHLVVLEQGAMLIDTPGMRELGLLAAGDGIDDTFKDIHDLAGACRFANCSHVQEPGCAVREAMDRGELSPERYESCLKLRKESEYHEMSYADRRRKEKAFGRFIKSAMKNVRK